MHQFDPNVADFEAPQPSMLERVQSTKFDYNQPIPNIDPVLTYWSNGRMYPVASKGMMGVFAGDEKSGKTYVASKIASSFIAKRGFKEYLNFELKAPGKFLWFDTEQDKTFFAITQKRIHDEAFKQGNIPNYEAYLLRDLNTKERMKAIEEVIFSTSDVDVVMIDGIVDLLLNYNDLEEVTEVRDTIMKWTAQRDFLLLTVLHLNKGDGKLRGHIGSEIKNKFNFVIKVEQPTRLCYKVSNPTGRYLTFPSMEFKRNEDTGEAEYLDGSKKLDFE